MKCMTVIAVNTALQTRRTRVQFLVLSIDIILPTALWPRVDSASDTNEHQNYFLG